jgi:hypothetical protein
MKSHHSFQKPLLALFLLLGFGMCNAATVLTTGDNQEIVTAISDLEVDGELYLDEFIFGLRDEAFILDTGVNVASLADAIVPELNAAVPEVILAGDATNNSDRLYILAATSGSALIYGLNDEVWEESLRLGLRVPSEGVFAKVTLIPIPPALWLFASSLGLLGWLKRRAN